MACSGLTVTYTGANPTTIISFTSCESDGGSFCDVTNWTINSGQSYYINARTLPSPITDLSITTQQGATNSYIFSSVCDTTSFFIRGKTGDFPLGVGDTYCLTAYNCTSGITLSGCYTLFSEIVGTPVGYDYFSRITYPTFSGSALSCTGTCACSPAAPCLDEYCISYTNTSYDGIYTYAGSYSGYSYWTGDTTPTYYIYNDGDGWCLSDSLGGSCFLSGKFPCISNCPDLCDSFFGVGPCSTTTTTTSPCNDFDFDGLFNCEVVPTPSPTPTQTITPTPTLTPTQTDFCFSLSVGATINSFSPTPSPTPTLTPTPSPEVIRPCNFSGDVTFTTIEGNIDCPRSLQFQDCLNGVMYYTTKSVSNPSGGDITQFMIFKSDVDGISRCISYIGINNDVIGVNNVELIEGPIGFLNQGDCILCIPNVSPTPTPTITPTITPTTTPTPTPTLKAQYYIYKRCRPIGKDKAGNPTYSYVVQTLQGPLTTPGTTIINYEPAGIGNLLTKVCWEYIGTSPNIPTFPLGNTVSFQSGNWFTPFSPTIYPDCQHCIQEQI